MRGLVRIALLTEEWASTQRHMSSFSSHTGMRVLHLCWCLSFGAGCNYRREASDHTGPVGRRLALGGAEVEQDIQAYFSYSCQQHCNLQIFTCTIQLVCGESTSCAPAPHSGVWLGVKISYISDPTSSKFQLFELESSFVRGYFIHFNRLGPNEAVCISHLIGIPKIT